ncbi:MAG: class I SAM-dependent methyltransferase [Candidatus Omnitrophica bacterium]|nr:class I SAM-dependent methyltransferase [Candidatus Omnitrophota bacterium]
MGLTNSASNAIFNNIAWRYDRVNTVLSFGLHEVWRARLARAFPAGTRSLLDLACGTGAIPLAFLRYRTDVTDLTGLDLSVQMLKIASQRLLNNGNHHLFSKSGDLIRCVGADFMSALRSGDNSSVCLSCRADTRSAPTLDKSLDLLHNYSPLVRLIEGDALNLTFKDDSFDAVTVGFALRNIPDVIKLLTSAYRVLKPGGYFGILEFSRPKALITRAFYWLYLSCIVPIVGLLITGNWAAYYHLGKSIKQFPEPERFHRMLAQSGFKEITAYPLALGAVTLYMAKK